MSIYMHIPFCKTICTYCDFCKMFYNEKFVSDYLNSLEKEIRIRYQNEEVETIYIGGGTPTSLSLNELERLLEITKIFKKKEEIEFTIEGNVESITSEKLKLMKKYGVNRISIGIQSLNESIIKKLGRVHTRDEVFEKIDLIKKYFNNINVDLIYAAYDRMDILKKDIEEFLKLDVNHISTYSLMIEDKTILKIQGYKNISEDLDYEMYNYIEKTLEKMGYIHYEISNYAKKGYMAKHNLVYWNNLPYYGFGLSSTSYIDNCRRVNTKNIHKYLAGLYMDSEEVEDKRRQMENEIMLNLRKFEGISLEAFKRKYGNDLDKEFNIDSLVNDGYLINDGKYVSINKNYMYVLNEILVRILN